MAVSLRPQSPGAHFNLGVAFYRKGRFDEAIAEFQEAIRLKGNYAEAHHNLAHVLHDRGRLDEAIAECREVIRLKKDDAAAHSDLAAGLGEKGQLNEAIAECREATRLKKDYAEAHNNLGDLLLDQGRVDEAIAECREAIRLKKGAATAHNNLAGALYAKGRPNGAIAEYREAIRLKDDYAEAHCGLATVLMAHGHFRQAAAEFRRGHELGSRNPRWPYPSAEWLQQARAMARLDNRLADLLAGRAMAKGPAEQLSLAELCVQPFKGLYAASARWYTQAFAAQPKFADDLNSGYRYNAACAATLAGCGQGKDAGKLSTAERAGLRAQALDWLTADLRRYGQSLHGGAGEASREIGQRLQHWLVDDDLAGVRGQQALDKLPRAERQDWNRLWQEVETMRRRAAGKPASAPTVGH